MGGHIHPVPINAGLIAHAVRDGAAHERRQTMYLDRTSGEIVWLFENDADAQATFGAGHRNSDLRRLIRSAPGRFLKLPVIDIDQRATIRDFIASHWGNNDPVRSGAEASFLAAPDRWLYDADATVIHAYHEYENRRLRDQVERFLLENGIVPLWR